MIFIRSCPACSGSPSVLKCPSVPLQQLAQARPVDAVVAADQGDEGVEGAAAGQGVQQGAAEAAGGVGVGGRGLKEGMTTHEVKGSS